MAIRKIEKSRSGDKKGSDADRDSASTSTRDDEDSNYTAWTDVEIMQSVPDEMDFDYHFQRSVVCRTDDKGLAIQESHVLGDCMPSRTMTGAICLWVFTHVFVNALPAFYYIYPYIMYFLFSLRHMAVRDTVMGTIGYLLTRYSNPEATEDREMWLKVLLNVVAFGSCPVTFEIMYAILVYVFDFHPFEPRTCPVPRDHM
jgi:hypothetical protein